MADIYLERQYWPAKNGVAKATVVVTLRELDDVLLSCGLPTCLHSRILGELKKRAGTNPDTDTGVMEVEGDEMDFEEEDWKTGSAFPIPVGTMAELALAALSDVRTAERSKCRKVLADVFEEANRDEDAGQLRATHTSWFVTADEYEAQVTYRDHRTAHEDATHEQAVLLLVHHTDFDSVAEWKAHRAGVESMQGCVFSNRSSAFAYVEDQLGDARLMFETP